jgi:hypothetical protein
MWKQRNNLIANLTARSTAQFPKQKGRLMQKLPFLFDDQTFSLM